MVESCDKSCLRREFPEQPRPRERETEHVWYVPMQPRIQNSSASALATRSVPGEHAALE